MFGKLLALTLNNVFSIAKSKFVTGSAKIADPNSTLLFA